MSERQMLEMGIRAMGVVFLFSIYDVMYPAKAIAAFLLVRYADRVASLLSDPTNAAVETQLLPAAHWNNWLVAMAAVFGVASTFVDSVWATAITLAFGRLILDIGVAGVIVALTLAATAEVAILAWFFGAVVHQRRWLMGAHANDV